MKIGFDDLYGSRRRIVHFLSGLLLFLLAPTTAYAADRLVLAFGDSLTAGYQLKPNEGFAPRLEAALRRQGMAARVHNGGVSGDTSAAGRARLNWLLTGLKAKPDLVIVELGANDMLRGLKPAETSANLDAIITTLKGRGIPVLLAGMRAAPNMGAAYRREFDAIYPRLAKTHGVPLYPFFLEGVAATPRLLLKDGMHPNPVGVDTIVRGILPSVTAALNRR